MIIIRKQMGQTLEWFLGLLCYPPKLNVGLNQEFLGYIAAAQWQIQTTLMNNNPFPSSTNGKIERHLQLSNLIRMKPLSMHKDTILRQLLAL